MCERESVCVCVRVGVCSEHALSIYVCMYVCMYVCIIRIYMYIYIYIYIYTYIYMHMHTSTHTQTNTHTQPAPLDPGASGGARNGQVAIRGRPPIGGYTRRVSRRTLATNLPFPSFVSPDLFMCVCVYTLHYQRLRGLYEEEDICMCVQTLSTASWFV